MMKIERDHYLSKLISKKWNGKVKIITGIRRCGKSFLLNDLFINHLLSAGVTNKCIVSLSLEDDVNMMYRNPVELSKHIREVVSDTGNQYYVIIDEIQKVESIANPYLPKDSESKITFVDVLLGLMKLPNVDIYVTGSNSKMLSTDILSDFRDRGDEIRVFPLTYSEFYKAYEGDKRYAWREYLTYGGMPYVMHLNTHEEKGEYLRKLFELTYMKDILERNNLKGKTETLEILLDTIASSVGSLSNPSRIANTFKSEKKINIKSETIASYLQYFENAFLISEAQRYDVKGRAYISTPLKYYFSDVGLRNARLNFRQQEESHIMENAIYNELIARNLSVDVGVVVHNYKDEDGISKQSKLEVDFIVNKGSQRFYIQSALNVDTSEKREQEINSFLRIEDSFLKIVVVKEDIIQWMDENGILYIGVQDFLLEYIDKNMC